MKKYLTIILLCMFGLFGAQSQTQVPTTDYLDKVFNPVAKRKAEYVRTFEAVDDDNYKATIRGKRKNKLRMTGEYRIIGGELKKHGAFTYYYANGQVESSGYYEENIKVGSWKRYTVNGTQRADRYYNPESADFLREVMAGDALPPGPSR